MKFKKLAIENFGVYKGVHRFNLKTNTDGNNLIIIKGPNGSGKSTFFTTVSLALFGRQTLGNKVRKKDYEKFILSRLHKNRIAGNTTHTNSASVSLTLEYVESGKRNEINISRSWTRNGSNISENLDIKKNGHPPEVQEVDYQTWLNDLFPPGLKTILCFDAEDMNSLVRAKNDVELKKVVKRLLGLHIVEQLNQDLEYYLRKKGGGTKYDSLKQEISVNQQILDRKKKHLKEKNEYIGKLTEQEKELSSDLNRLERELASEGGDYAARRPLIKERIEQLDEQIEQDENKLIKLSSGLLPFSLAPSLSEKLNLRLQKELELHRKQITSDFIQDKIDDLSDSLSNSDIWKDIEVDKHQSKKILNHLKVLLEEEVNQNGKEHALVHELAENDILKLQGWIQEVENSIPDLALHISDELRSKKKEREEHKEYLNRAPDDKILEPIFDQIREKEKKLQKVRKQIGRASEEIGSIEFKLEEVERKHEKLTDQLKDIEKEKRNFSLAEKSQLALKSYHESLAVNRLQELCSELVECFNRICDKDQLLSKAEINIESFEVKLTDKNDETVSVDDLSMGESQLYGISLLWALRNISGYSLPLLIDTPVARLDKTHRNNFIHKYLPEVSEQVLLFATNAEMEDHVQNKLQPNIAHEYELKFDKEKGETKVNGEDHVHDESMSKLEV